MTHKKIFTTIESLKKRLVYEKELYNKGLRHIVGIDEVGRGPLAGPMVFSAVALDLQQIFNSINKIQDLAHKTDENINNDVTLFLEQTAQINDSKKLSAKKREESAVFIKQSALKYSIFEIDNHTLDNIGLAKATQAGFFSALKNLNIDVEHVLTDQYKINAFNSSKQTYVTRGDQLSLTIGAASILAKTYRDGLMLKIHDEFPLYGFDKNKGYGTKLHIEQIRLLGPCEHHRATFEPLKSFIEG